MIRAIFLFILPMALITSLSAAESSRKEDEQAIRQILEVDMINAWNRHDAKTLANFWSEDGDLLTPWEKLAINRDEIEKLFTNDFDGRMKNSQIKQKITRIRFIRPDMAYVDADGTLSGIQENQTAFRPINDRIAYIFENEKGEWKILIARPF